MRKLKLLLIFSFLFFLTSCSELIITITRIVNIDSNEPNLELHFDFRRTSDQKISRVNRIQIIRNDSLICQLTANTGYGISEWDFPSIPEGFVISYPDTNKILPKLLKSQGVLFKFGGGIKFPGHGSWYYKPRYTEKEYRWQFDEHGNQKIIIQCLYEPWVGKDIISVRSTEEFTVSDSTFVLNQVNGEPIEFELKYKRNPTKNIALVLEKKFKKGTRLNINFQAHEGNFYNQLIYVPDRSTIGLSGKFNDL
jgi:hypothetical protein